MPPMLILFLCRFKSSCINENKNCADIAKVETCGVTEEYENLNSVFEQESLSGCSLEEEAHIFTSKMSSRDNNMCGNKTQFSILPGLKLEEIEQKMYAQCCVRSSEAMSSSSKLTEIYIIWKRLVSTITEYFDAVVYDSNSMEKTDAVVGPTDVSSAETRENIAIRHNIILNKIKAAEKGGFFSLKCGMCLFIFTVCSNNELIISNELVFDLEHILFVASDNRILEGALSLMKELAISSKTPDIWSFNYFLNDFNEYLLPGLFKWDLFYERDFYSIQLSNLMLKLKFSLIILSTSTYKSILDEFKIKLPTLEAGFVVNDENEKNINGIAFALFLILQEIQSKILRYTAFKDKFKVGITMIDSEAINFVKKEISLYLSALVDRFNELLVKA
jgi:hypothetical protein